MAGRYLIVSDIHANRYALEAVIKDAGAVDGCWCLGDVLGYGPHPAEVLKLLRDKLRPSVWMLGNHDAAIVGRITMNDAWGELPKQAIGRNLELLAMAGNEEIAIWARQFLTYNCPIGPLPFSINERDQAYFAVHGLIESPLHGFLREVLGTKWDISPMIAKGEFIRLRYLCHACVQLEEDIATKPRRLFVGNTHLPTFLRANSAEPAGDERYSGEFEQMKIEFNAGPQELGPMPIIINPGSVGQPRDGDPRAAYAIYDALDDTIEFRRVEYDIARTQAQMRRAADNKPFPEDLWKRLEHGN